MRNSMFVLIFVSSLVFISCGNEGNIQESVQTVCETSTSICGNVTDLCKLYNIPTACNIANEVCYYTNHICSVIMTEKSTLKIEKARNELKELSEMLDNIKSENSIGDMPVMIDSKVITNVLEQLKIIDQRLSQ